MENIERVDGIADSPEIKISIIMPIYNAYDYLRPAIDSVLDQTLREIELICIDDGSTDHSLDIIREYKKKNAPVGAFLFIFRPEPQRPVLLPLGTGASRFSA